MTYLVLAKHMHMPMPIFISIIMDAIYFIAIDSMLRIPILCGQPGNVLLLLSSVISRFRTVIIIISILCDMSTNFSNSLVAPGRMTGWQGMLQIDRAVGDIADCRSNLTSNVSVIQPYTFKNDFVFPAICPTYVIFIIMGHILPVQSPLTIYLLLIM